MRWILLLLLCLLLPVPASAASHPGGCTGGTCRATTRDRVVRVETHRVRTVRKSRIVRWGR
jgi:hypothetical protein